jgi:hypothetical protein
MACSNAHPVRPQSDSFIPRLPSTRHKQVRLTLLYGGAHPCDLWGNKVGLIERLHNPQEKHAYIAFEETDNQNCAPCSCYAVMQCVSMFTAGGMQCAVPSVHAYHNKTHGSLKNFFSPGSPTVSSRVPSTIYTLVFALSTRDVETTMAA